MAVTVTQQPFVALDSADRIVEVGSHAESQFGPLIGSVLWDCFPGARPLFKPYYDGARASREPVDFVQFYDGYVVRVVATAAAEERLEVQWEQLAHIDTTTLEDLVVSLTQTLAALAEKERVYQRDALRRTLTLIEGGV